MAKSTAQFPANNPTTPLDRINNVLQQLQLVYPALNFGVWRVVAGHTLTGGLNDGNSDGKNKFECLVGNHQPTTLVEELKTCVSAALHDNKEWFRSSTDDPTAVLLAIINLDILKLLDIKEGPFNGQDGIDRNITMEEQASKQTYFLCISRKDVSSPLDFDLMNAKDIALLKIITGQLSQYITLYNLMVYTGQNLKIFRHDLRTPLTSVSMIGGLLMGEVPLDEDELPEFAQMLFTAVEKMDALLSAFKIEIN